VIRRGQILPLSMAASALAMPAPVHAHLVTTGLGPFYDGMSHFFVSFEDLLPTLAIALLAGLRGARAGRLALFALPATWLIGGLLAATKPLTVSTPMVAVGALLGAGLLAAADCRLRPAMVAPIAGLFGFAGGYLSASAVAVAAGLSAPGLLGATIAPFVVVALVAAAVVGLQQRPARIGFRVAGSWLAAIGLLRLGWLLSGAG